MGLERPNHPNKLSKKITKYETYVSIFNILKLITIEKVTPKRHPVTLVRKSLVETYLEFRN